MIGLLKKNNNKGITLVELIIVLSLIGIIFVLAFQLNIFAILGIRTGQERAQVQHNVRLASDYITKELRNAYTINILPSLPDPLDTGRRYLYVEGNTIKHYQSGNITDIMRDPPVDMVPTLTFVRDANNSRVIKCTVSGLYEEKVFDLETTVSPSNLLVSETINGTSGYVLEYSSPLSAEEIVAIDTMLLDLHKRNLYLVEEADSSLTSLPYPNPDSILLPKFGPNGSVITWVSNKTILITNDGYIIRPGINAGDDSAKLTATLTFTGESETKEFNINVKDMEPLSINPSTIPAATVGTNYTYALKALGGTGVYTFSSADLATYSLAIDPTGVITGMPTAQPGGTQNYTFTVTLSDNYSPANIDDFIITIPINH